MIDYPEISTDADIKDEGEAAGKAPARKRNLPPYLKNDYVLGKQLENFEETPKPCKQQILRKSISKILYKSSAF